MKYDWSQDSPDYWVVVTRGNDADPIEYVAVQRDDFDDTWEWKVWAGDQSGYDPQDSRSGFDSAEAAMQDFEDGTYGSRVVNLSESDSPIDEEGYNAKFMGDDEEHYINDDLGYERSKDAMTHNEDEGRDRFLDQRQVQEDFMIGEEPEWPEGIEEDMEDPWPDYDHELPIAKKSSRMKTVQRSRKQEKDMPKSAALELNWQTDASVSAREAYKARNKWGRGMAYAYEISPGGQWHWYVSRRGDEGSWSAEEGASGDAPDKESAMTAAENSLRSGSGWQSSKKSAELKDWYDGTNDSIVKRVSSLDKERKSLRKQLSDPQLSNLSTRHLAGKLAGVEEEQKKLREIISATADTVWDDSVYADLPLAEAEQYEAAIDDDGMLQLGEDDGSAIYAAVKEMQDEAREYDWQVFATSYAEDWALRQSPDRQENQLIMRNAAIDYAQSKTAMILDVPKRAAIIDQFVSSVEKARRLQRKSYRHQPETKSSKQKSGVDEIETWEDGHGWNARVFVRGDSVVFNASTEEDAREKAENYLRKSAQIASVNWSPDGEGGFIGEEDGATFFVPGGVGYNNFDAEVTLSDGTFLHETDFETAEEAKAWAELQRSASKKTAAKPPNLRLTDDPEINCETCKAYSTETSRVSVGHDGVCTAYEDYPVDADELCDSWTAKGTESSKQKSAVDDWHWDPNSIEYINQKKDVAADDPSVFDVTSASKKKQRQAGEVRMNGFSYDPDFGWFTNPRQLGLEDYETWYVDDDYEIVVEGVNPDDFEKWEQAYGNDANVHFSSKQKSSEIDLDWEFDEWGAQAELGDGGGVDWDSEMKHYYIRDSQGNILDEGSAEDLTDASQAYNDFTRQSSKQKQAGLSWDGINQAFYGETSDGGHVEVWEDPPGNFNATVTDPGSGGVRDIAGYNVDEGHGSGIQGQVNTLSEFADEVTRLVIGSKQSRVVKQGASINFPGGTIEAEIVLRAEGMVPRYTVVLDDGQILDRISSVQAREALENYVDIQQANRLVEIAFSAAEGTGQFAVSPIEGSKKTAAQGWERQEYENTPSEVEDEEEMSEREYRRLKRLEGPAPQINDPRLYENDYDQTFLSSKTATKVDSGLDWREEPDPWSSGVNFSADHEGQYALVVPTGGKFLWQVGDPSAEEVVAEGKESSADAAKAAAESALLGSSGWGGGSFASKKTANEPVWEPAFGGGGVFSYMPGAFIEIEEDGSWTVSPSDEDVPWLEGSAGSFEEAKQQALEAAEQTRQHFANKKTATPIPGIECPGCGGSVATDDLTGGLYCVNCYRHFRADELQSSLGPDNVWQDEEDYMIHPEEDDEGDFVYTSKKTAQEHNPFYDDPNVEACPDCGNRELNVDSETDEYGNYDVSCSQCGWSGNANEFTN